MIRANGISKTYTEPLFSDLSFTIGKNTKIGLVGLNGCGKTTIFKLLSRQELPDSGGIEVSAEEKIGYLPQEFDFGPHKTITDFFKSFLKDYYAELWKVQVSAGKMGLDLEAVQEIHKLSEGNKMKLYLTKILYEEPTLLLMDEPTNHLDITGILWCEEFVSSFNGACLIISHDRQFLNNTIERVFEIDKKQLNIFEGNYDDYLIQKQAEIEKQNEQFFRQQKKQAQLEQLIVNSRRITDGKRRGKAVQAAKKRLEREVVQAKVDKYVKEEIKDIDFKGAVHNRKRIINVESLDFSYPGTNTKIFNNTDFAMFGSERIWFYGANGSGKSTFVKLLVGELEAKSGKVELGNNLTWEYFSQNQSHLPLDQTIQEFIYANTSMGLGELYGFLESFLFTRNMLNIRLKALSPGQRARLNFAVFSRKESQLLILDEPTNHLDIQTKEIIQSSLQEYDGAIFLISHDRYFAERVATDRKVTIRGNKIVEVD